ncbi:MULTISPECIES: glycosyltransferase [unclassified Enterococcus]|uniref:glycosyltransferase n=1 Tax=unclassified Enterococcus TaxID=2608891 RepID=UPI0015552C09|nr:MULTISPECIES: glycosyltransferase [unclassified Enterococcus]MBS7576264.1 glycosyltransferase [Enterococcus sp. MMGLQ5-2]MBS7583497.1 glycosyltransferase [Enterococcus sp. MMGLQ5-1]NPD11359.1 glycosyltransferase [Enterococcus sp. MMGLQ5-1]NPD36102.1 glycosyltransferase [Enterococcus sp. MMGLQ5-2]
MLKHQSILFVTTKNKDYIRNVQEIKLIQKFAKGTIIISEASDFYLLKLLKIYFKVLIKLCFGRFQTVFIGFSPQLLTPFFPFIKKKVLIVDFFISLYETLVIERQIIKNKSFLAKWFFWLDGYTLRQAQWIIVDTQADALYFSKTFQIPLNKFEILYLEGDQSIYVPKSANRKTRNGLCEVVYFGSILPMQGVEIILEAANLLRSQNKYQFTIVGPVLKKMKISPANYPNVNFITYLPQAELAILLNHSDLALGGHFNGSFDKANRVIPGKVFIYQLMQLPIILGDSTGNRELFPNETTFLHYVERGNAQALANKIIEIAEKKLENN